MRTIYCSEKKDTIVNGESQTLELSLKYDNKLKCNWLLVLFSNDTYASELAMRLELDELETIKNSIEKFLKEKLR